jgi:hypothetical protein
VGNAVLVVRLSLAVSGFGLVLARRRHGLLVSLTRSGPGRVDLNLGPLRVELALDPPCEHNGQRSYDSHNARKE